MNNRFARRMLAEPLPTDHPGDTLAAVSEKATPEEKAKAEPARQALDQGPPAAKGVPQIEVAFNMDANGLLTVSAKAGELIEAIERISGRVTPPFSLIPPSQWMPG